MGEGHGNYQLKYKNGKCHLTFPFALYNNFYLFYTPVYVGEGECTLTYHEQNNKNSSGYMEYGDIKIKQTGPTKRDKREE